MSDLSFTIFKKPDDYTSWRKLIEYANVHPDFSLEEKKAIAIALNSISQILGKNFLFTTQAFNHPIYQHFRNLAPWAIKWSIWFSQALQDLIRNDVDGKLLSDLKSKGRNEEAFTYLEINHYLTQSGFSIKFEQPVTVKDQTRYPDLKLTNSFTNEIIYIELSSLHMHQEHDWNRSLFHRLSKIFSSGMFEKGLNHGGRVRNLSKENFDEIVQQIEEFKKSIVSRELLYTLENDHLTIGAGGEKCLPDLSAWATEHDIGLNSFTGEVITLSGEISRIKKKIKDKSVQLSENDFNIIAISMHSLFMMGGDKIEMLVKLMSYLENFPHIYGVLIFGHNPLAKINQDPKGLGDWHLEAPFGHFISLRTVAELRTTEFYFSRNPIAKILDPQTEQMLYKAFLFGERMNPEGENFDRNSSPLS